MVETDAGASLDRPPALVHESPLPAAPTVESRIGRKPIAGPPPRTELQVYCCPTAHRTFASRLESAFETKEPGIDLILHTRGDRDCAGHLMMGNADVAIISTALSPSERARGLTDQVIAHLIVVPVVHRTNPIESIPVSDFALLTRGNYSNWRRLGGKDLDIQIVCKHRPRVEDAADLALRVTGEAQNLAVFLSEPREILAYVANHPRAFGLVSLAHVQGVRNVRTLQISQVAASRKMFVDGVWPLGATIRGITPRNPTTGARAFLEFLKSDTARKVIQLELTLPTR
jgi:ABC-type phosphate transport system substrate-binding protein